VYIFIEHVLHRSALLFDACIDEACPRCFDFLVPVLDNDKTPDEDDEDRGEEKSKNLRNRRIFVVFPRNVLLVVVEDSGSDLDRYRCKFSDKFVRR